MSEPDSKVDSRRPMLGAAPLVGSPAVCFASRMPRSKLARTKTLVVKVGTGTLTDASGRFDPHNCARLAAELAEVGRGRRLVLVSSAAIAFGAEKLGLVRSRAKPWDIATKQAAAAVGQ